MVDRRQDAAQCRRVTQQFVRDDNARLTTGRSDHASQEVLYSKRGGAPEMLSEYRSIDTRTTDEWRSGVTVVTAGLAWGFSGAAKDAGQSQTHALASLCWPLSTRLRDMVADEVCAYAARLLDLYDALQTLLRAGD
jgi:hypothetical protein